MATLGARRCEILRHRIETIEIYEVLDVELRSIELSCGLLSQDLTFAVSAVSVGVTVGTSLIVGTFAPTVFIAFATVGLVSAVVAVYTGLRWWRHRAATLATLAAIRTRSVVTR